MRDKRPVDELSIEELERVLAIKKREERQQRIEKMRRSGRIVDNDVAEPSQYAAALPPTPLHVPAPVAVQNPPTQQRETASARSAARISGEDDLAHPYFEDDGSGGAALNVHATAKTTAAAQNQSRFWKHMVNRSLLMVEVAAVAGLLFIGYSLIQAVDVLDRETAAAQQLAEEQRRAGIPTIAATPVLQLDEIVLPGGHTPPTSAGGAQFNFAEIPSHLLPVVQSQLAQPVINRPAPTVETALFLIIPQLNLNQSIVQGVDWEALKQGVGQLQNGVNPGDDVGNVVLSAHNDIYGELFRYLDRLEPGDQFQLQTQTQIYTYTVTGRDIVAPTDTHVMASRGNASITLISCYPYQVDTQRIVVFADRAAL
ncbi:MAG: class D sortase [Burkholderiales bacterium]|nr:class D sortase [Anaerolineae bacterium]